MVLVNKRGEENMLEKCLGKITSAEYGIHKDYPYLFGVQLGLK